MAESSFLSERSNPTFSGFETQWDQLTKAFLDNKLPHAVLLTGPKGIGKATFAFHLARFILASPSQRASCQDPSTPFFKQILSGAYPDLCALPNPGETTISIEDTRQVVSFLTQKPLMGEWRVVIIDSLNDMAPKASNTLLKTLEEPPSKTLLILLAHETSSLLPTIRSRCQVLACPTLSLEQTTQVLKKLCPSQAEFLAPLSMGRPGFGLMLNQLGGQAFFESFLTVLDSLARGSLVPLFPFMEKEILKKDLTFQALEFMHTWLLASLSRLLQGDTSFQGASSLSLLLETHSPESIAQALLAWSKSEKSSQIYNLDKKQTLVSFFSQIGCLTRI